MTAHETDTPMDEGPLTGAAAEAVAAYNAPGELVPREAMWQAIAARRAAAAGRATPVTPIGSGGARALQTRAGARRIPAWSYAVAATALLAVGIGIGQRFATNGSLRSTSVAVDTTVSTVAWQVASTEHFGAAETMLTWYASSPKARTDAQLSAWSRDLLASTRLLIDSPAGRDPKRRALLLELELVLVQLVESGPAVRAEDRTLFDEMLSRSSLLLTRLRTTVPAGMSAAQD